MSSVVLHLNHSAKLLQKTPHFAFFPITEIRIPYNRDSTSFLGGFYKFALLDFGIIFEVNRRTSERRAELARAIPSEEEEDVVKL